MEPTKPSSLFPLETCSQISDEEFNLFHSIDRELFTRLVHNLGRDPAQSMQVMAFFMWLERQSSDMNLVKRMLTLPPLLLNEVADEAVTCLKCAESDQYPFSDVNPVAITLLPDLMRNRVVSVGFFHENRIAVLRGVSKIIDTVCARAFHDILQQKWQADVATGGRAAPVQFTGPSNQVGESSRTAEKRNEIPPLAQPPVLLYNPYLDVPFVQLPPSAGTGTMIRMLPPPQVAAPPQVHQSPAVEHAIGIPVQMVAAAGGFPVYDLEVQRQMLGNELGQMLEQTLVISSNNREEIRNVNYGEQVDEVQIGGGGEVSADDRTIFLTFSKGYPITEDEIREFFTKRFGDFIEDLIMQEVGEDEQVLYARMVARARSTAVIDGIVGGNKAKYSINGKHVWARKYVKKQHAPTPPGVIGESSSRQSSTPEE